MSFVQPITILEAINSVHKKNYVLPAIQREFVWSTEQIEKLFDSLMRDYPISSFLFWEIEKEKAKDYQFYEFIRNYHERDKRHNPKADIRGDSCITAILDGQQRLTSLYIGLKGTYANKLPRMHWGKDSAFPERKLYLNLKSPIQNGDMEFDFKFLTEEESKKIDANVFWFEVGKIIDFNDLSEVNDFLIENDLTSIPKEQAKFANKTLFKLYEVIIQNKSINFFLEKDVSLDKVLNIFIRVNNGGTKLNYSDLLLSIATAQWKEKDARDEITNFVDEINKIGEGFSFSKDFVLKSCLVLSDIKDITFKVDNFNQKNMLDIEKNWDEITSSIRSSIYLIANFGFHRDTLTSNNSIIPIAYFLKRINNPKNFCDSTNYTEDRKKIFNWLLISTLKRTFGGHSDTVLRAIREVLKGDLTTFPYEQIFNNLKGSEKSMNFDEDEIKNLLFYKYGQPYTYSILAFIYPSLNFKNKFHQDHIFPKKMFVKDHLKKMGLNENDIEYFIEKSNSIANLQLLEGTQNQEKSDKNFSDWLNETYPDKSNKIMFMQHNHIPEIDLSITNFKNFIIEREKIILEKFKHLLQIV